MSRSREVLPTGFTLLWLTLRKFLWQVLQNQRMLHPPKSLVASFLNWVRNRCSLKTREASVSASGVLFVTTFPLIEASHFHVFFFLSFSFQSLQGTALGIYNWGIYIGVSLAFALKELVSAVGWRWTYRVSGFPGLLLAPVVFFAVKEPERRSASNHHVSEILERGIPGVRDTRPSLFIVWVRVLSFPCVRPPWYSNLCCHCRAKVCRFKSINGYSHIKQKYLASLDLIRANALWTKTWVLNLSVLLLLMFFIQAAQIHSWQLVNCEWLFVLSFCVCFNPTAGKPRPGVFLQTLTPPNVPWNLPMGDFPGVSGEWSAHGGWLCPAL